MIAIHIPKLEYTTRAVTRRISVDMPFADYRHGAPYGEKNGPAIGVIGAIGTVSAGFAATNAVIGGILIAGGIASGLGALTGNKALSTFGAIAGLAGGIGGSFVTAGTAAEGGGQFFNPFTDTRGFGGSVTGSAIKSVFSDIKGGLGITDNAAVADIKANAGVNVPPAADTIDAASKSEGFLLDGQSPTAFGRAFDGVKEAGTGLLGSLNNNQGAVSALGGLADGFVEKQKLDLLQPLRDAQVEGTNADTAGQLQQNQITAQRQENLQFQPNSALQINPNQQIYNKAPGEGNAGKYAVAINGTIKYVTQAEYDAMRQAQGGTGMLAQGAA